MTNEPFSAQLRRATWGEHRRAERGPYLDALMAGELSLAGYAQMVAQHYFAYEVLEESAHIMRARADAAPFADHRLSRLPALIADLKFLLGDDWLDHISPTASTVRYQTRMREVCASWPGGFVAHHYTRYLGDLSGGQFIAAELVRIFELPDRHGVQFYAFDELGDLASFKASYRALLDAAPWDAAERQRIADEVALAYRLNADVLDDLGRCLDLA